ncbi:zf-TFIIB domain-containing protein [Candidatus Palauibacter irciniicola]|uniref:TFIIB-type zinc ribbon-containing protein n=1 Tax=Candidatus Palauibacter irciniicola TaxID=3056733 RepID=UPI003B026831
MTETRWPCPVCLGTRMEKTSLGAGAGDAAGPLTLDHCGRCGGMWFEFGEVQRLRSERPESLWARIPAREERHRAQCHACRAFVDRDAPKCAACGAKTRLNCPACDTRMLQVRQSSLTLDVCKRCKGVWFDHHELEAIWEMERDRLVARRGRDGAVARTADTGADVLFETLFWAPDLVFVGAHVAGHAVAAAAEAAPAALDTVGDAAASVFEAILEIVGGIFG